MAEIVSETFQIDFLPTEPVEGGVQEEDLYLGGDAPEPLYETLLDLTEIAIQQLSLDMAPYPRKLDSEPLEDVAAQPEISPFASLERLSAPDQD